MRSDTIGASAPGNMILIGEYAVLEGAPALMMTLKNRLHVTLAPSDVLTISSDMFGTWKSLGLRDWLRAWAVRGNGGAQSKHVHLCRNVLSAFFTHYGFAPEAFSISIHSEIPPTYGFGSSAALVAALTRALHRVFGREEDFRQMFAIGHQAILATFRRGSGADLAAALADEPYAVFSPRGKSVAPFQMPFTVQAIYTGYKTPTPEVLKRVKSRTPAKTWEDLARRMSACAASFIESPAAASVREYQGLMDELGVTCAATRRALDAFEAMGVPAKISGAGMGDCVVGFTAAPCVVEVRPPLKFIHARDLRW